MGGYSTDRCFINAVQDFWLFLNPGSLILSSAAKWASHCCTKITSAQLTEEPDLSTSDPWFKEQNHALFEDQESFAPVFYGIQTKALKGGVSCGSVEVMWLCLQKSCHYGTLGDSQGFLYNKTNSRRKKNVFCIFTRIINVCIICTNIQLKCIPTNMHTYICTYQCHFCTHSFVD